MLTTTTTACLLISLAALTLGVFRLRHESAVAGARIARLEDVLTRLTREEIGASVRISTVERVLDQTRARQDTLECRATGGPRIESALRLARQGTASEDMLRELGLSAAEASLLLRLNQAGPAPLSDAARLTPAQASPSDPQSAPESKEAGSVAVSPPPTQAASLARMLAAQDDAA